MRVYWYEIEVTHDEVPQLAVMINVNIKVVQRLF